MLSVQISPSVGLPFIPSKSYYLLIFVATSSMTISSWGVVVDLNLLRINKIITEVDSCVLST